MAPSRHKRGRSSTSSRASTNVHKTEVTINVYDLLPVSSMVYCDFTAQRHNGECHKLQAIHREELRILHGTPRGINEIEKTNLDTALLTINSPLDHRLLAPPLRGRPLSPQQRSNRIRLRRPPSTSQNRRLPHSPARHTSRSFFPPQHTARHLISLTSGNRRDREEHGGKIHGARVRSAEQELQPFHQRAVL
jgi:hypothetical protein